MLWRGTPVQQVVVRHTKRFFKILHSQLNYHIYPDTPIKGEKKGRLNWFPFVNKVPFVRVNDLDFLTMLIEDIANIRYSCLTPLTVGKLDPTRVLLNCLMNGFVV